MNYNRIIIGGHLTRDVEVQFVGGYNVAKFGVAVSRRFKNRAGQNVEETTFVDCEAWGDIGKTIFTYFKKGMPILVEGKLKQSAWVTKTGEKRNRHFVAVDTFNFVAKKSDDAQPDAAPAPAPAPTTDAAADENVPF